jgi:uncharacterized protein (TIGR02217 family)
MALPVFPSLPGLAWPVKRTTRWLNVEQDALSGKRSRYPLWTFPIYLYELSFNVLRTANAFTEWQTLTAFINSVQGSAQLWAYSDPNDSAVTLQGFGQGDGTSVNFQLVRALGGFTEPVFLVNGAPSIYVAGVLQIVGTNYTISAYGVVTFISPPANGASLQWTGGYYFPCRFDGDAFAFTQAMSSYFKFGGLKFSTEKLP